METSQPNWHWSRLCFDIVRVQRRTQGIMDYLLFSVAWQHQCVVDFVQNHSTIHWSCYATGNNKTSSMLRICIWTLKISNIYSNRVHICKTTSDQTSKQIFLIFFSGCWGRRWAYWIVYCSQWHGRINVLWNDLGQNACFQNDHIGCVFNEFCWNDCLHVYYELWLYCSSLLHCLSLRVSFEFII